MMLVLASSPKSAVQANAQKGRSRKQRSRFVAYVLGALFAEFVKGALGR